CWRQAPAVMCWSWQRSSIKARAPRASWAARVSRSNATGLVLGARAKRGRPRGALRLSTRDRADNPRNREADHGDEGCTSAVGSLTVLSVTAGLHAQQAQMSFFVTSVGKGNGADLGGLEGADAHCAALAKAAGAAATNWRAYLSTTAPGGDAGVNARDRIG